MYLYVYVCSVYTHMRTYTCANTLIHTHYCSTGHISISAFKAPTVEFGRETCQHDYTETSPSHTELQGSTAQTDRHGGGNQEHSAPPGSWRMGALWDTVSPHTSAELEESIVCAENQFGGGEWRGGSVPSLGDVSDSRGCHNHPRAKATLCLPPDAPWKQRYVFSCLLGTSTGMANRYFECNIPETKLLTSLSHPSLSQALLPQKFPPFPLLFKPSIEVIHHALLFFLFRNPVH